MSVPFRLTALLALLCLGSSLCLGQLTYNTTFITHIPGNPGGLVVADMNRDGLPDLAVIDGTTVTIFFNHGSGTFGPAHNTALPNTGAIPVMMLAADVNNDGKIDLVIAQQQPNELLVLLGNGDGTFRPPVTQSLVNAPQAIALGDLNNDGKVDVAVSECPSSQTGCDIAVYRGTGTASFGRRHVFRSEHGRDRSQSGRQTGYRGCRAWRPEQLTYCHLEGFLWQWEWNLQRARRRSCSLYRSA